MTEALWYPITEPASRGGAFRSPFGGTWPDLPDASRWLEGMFENGWLTADDAKRFRFWIEHGYVRVPGAVPLDRVDALNAAIDEPFLRWVYEQSVARGCELVKSRPKKGDALIWHLDLVHGGAQEVVEGSTRKSIVTHFCPVDVVPSWFRDDYPHSERIVDSESGASFCHVGR